MSACRSCLYLDWYILVEKAKAVYVDDCQFYPEMAGKVKHKNECPRFNDKLNSEDDNGLEEPSE